MPGSEGVQQQRRICTGECDKDQSTVETRFVRCSVETDCQKEETDQSEVKGYYFFRLFLLLNSMYII